MGGSDNGEIYIDCQPVGLTKESTYILTDTRNFHLLTIQDWLENPIVKLLLCSLVFIKYDKYNKKRYNKFNNI
jgi:hypothetical protein